MLNEQSGKSAKSDAPGGDGAGGVSSQLLRRDIGEYMDNFAGTVIPFPELTEEEKTTALGSSMTFVMGLFLSMTQHLMLERAEAERLAKEAEHELNNGKPPASQK